MDQRILSLNVIIPAIDKNTISRSMSYLKEAHMLIDENKFLLKCNVDESKLI